MKRSTLTRSRPLRSRARRRPENTPQRQAWKTAREGRCAVCGRYGIVFRHHVLTEQAIRQAGRPDLAYDLRDALDIGAECSCHHDHHSAKRRIPLPLVSDEAIAFAVEVLGGDERAADWLARRYAPEIDGEGWQP